jgi:hypothetical protein
MTKRALPLRFIPLRTRLSYTHLLSALTPIHLSSIHPFTRPLCIHSALRHPSSFRLQQEAVLEIPTASLAEFIHRQSKSNTKWWRNVRIRSEFGTLRSARFYSTTPLIRVRLRLKKVSEAASSGGTGPDVSMNFSVTHPGVPNS